MYTKEQVRSMLGISGKTLQKDIKEGKLKSEENDIFTLKAINDYVDGKNSIRMKINMFYFLAEDADVSLMYNIRKMFEDILHVTALYDEYKLFSKQTSYGPDWEMEKSQQDSIQKIVDTINRQIFLCNSLARDYGMTPIFSEKFYTYEEIIKIAKKLRK